MFPSSGNVSTGLGGLPSQAGQVSAVQSALNTLDTRLTELTEQLGRLDGKLAPILTPTPPTASAESMKDSGGESDVVRKLRLCITTVESLIVGVKELHQRLQL